MMQCTRISYNNSMVWNITVHIRVWSYQNIITDFNFSYNCSIDSDPNLISYYRDPFPAPSILLSNRNTLMDITVFSNNRIRIYGNIVRMPQI